MISLTFETRPVPWSRTLRGEKSKRQKKQDKYIADLAMMLKLASNETFEGAVKVQLCFDYKLNHTLIYVSDMSHRPDLKTTRSDLDNNCKLVLEALQASGIVKDDAQVAVLEAEKVK